MSAAARLPVRSDSGRAHFIVIESIDTVGLPDITPELARESGFLGLLNLLKVARHGRGQIIYLIRFHYIRPRAAKESRRKSPKGKSS